MVKMMTTAETSTVPLHVATMTASEKQRSSQLYFTLFALVQTTAADGSGEQRRRRRFHSTQMKFERFWALSSKSELGGPSELISINDSNVFLPTTLFFDEGCPKGDETTRTCAHAPLLQHFWSAPTLSGHRFGTATQYMLPKAKSFFVWLRSKTLENQTQTSHCDISRKKRRQKTEGKEGGEGESNPNRHGDQTPDELAQETTIVCVWMSSEASKRSPKD